jgi:hypothetical protein
MQDIKKMKKNVVQDVVPAKKSIRNVTLSSRPGNTSRTTEKAPPLRRRPEDDEFTRPVSIKQAPIKIEPKIETPPSPIYTPPSVPPRSPLPTSEYKYDFVEPKKPSKKWRYVTILGLVLVVGFAVSALFKSAVIKVTPKEETNTLNQTFRAIKDTTGATLGFQVVTISKDAEKTVEASGEGQVDRKSTGKIVIYNENSQSQKLVATTRFETSDGLVFRLLNAVTIPAATTKDGKLVAGSVEVSVEADKAGQNYNIGLKDFTLPGLKGDPKFKTIYGRSKTEMTGGFSGVQKVVAKDVLNQAENDMSIELKDSLAKDISTQIPANFVLYTGSLSYKLSPAEQVSSTATGATLRKKGTVTAVIFDKTALTKAILSKSMPSLTADQVKIANLDSLDFAVATGTPFEPSVDTLLNFTLKGDAKVVYIFDENKLKNDLLGLTRAKAKTVLSTYEGIKEAWVETHPFWNQTIPKDENKVTLINTASQ